MIAATILLYIDLRGRELVVEAAVHVVDANLLSLVEYECEEELSRMTVDKELGDEHAKKPVDIHPARLPS